MAAAAGLLCPEAVASGGFRDYSRGNLSALSQRTAAETGKLAALDSVGSNEDVNASGSGNVSRKAGQTSQSYRATTTLLVTGAAPHSSLATALTFADEDKNSSSFVGLRPGLTSADADGPASENGYASNSSFASSASSNSSASASANDSRNDSSGFSDGKLAGSTSDKDEPVTASTLHEWFTALTEHEILANDNVDCQSCSNEKSHGSICKSPSQCLSQLLWAVSRALQTPMALPAPFDPLAHITAAGGATTLGFGAGSGRGSASPRVDVGKATTVVAPWQVLPFHLLAKIATAAAATAAGIAAALTDTTATAVSSASSSAACDHARSDCERKSDCGSDNQGGHIDSSLLSCPTATTSPLAPFVASLLKPLELKTMCVTALHDRYESALVTVAARRRALAFSAPTAATGDAAGYTSSVNSAKEAGAKAVLSLPSPLRCLNELLLVEDEDNTILCSSNINRNSAKGGSHNKTARVSASGDAPATSASEHVLAPLSALLSRSLWRPAARAAPAAAAAALAAVPAAALPWALTVTGLAPGAALAHAGYSKAGHGSARGADADSDCDRGRGGEGGSSAGLWLPLVSLVLARAVMGSPVVRAKAGLVLLAALAPASTAVSNKLDTTENCDASAENGSLTSSNVSLSGSYAGDTVSEINADNGEITDINIAVADALGRILSRCDSTSSHTLSLSRVPIMPPLPQALAHYWHYPSVGRDLTSNMHGLSYEQRLALLSRFASMRVQSSLWLSTAPLYQAALQESQATAAGSSVLPLATLQLSLALTLTVTPLLHSLPIITDATTRALSAAASSGFASVSRSVGSSSLSRSSVNNNFSGSALSSLSLLMTTLVAAAPSTGAVEEAAAATASAASALAPLLQSLAISLESEPQRLSRVCPRAFLLGTVLPMLAGRSSDFSISVDGASAESASVSTMAYEWHRHTVAPRTRAHSRTRARAPMGAPGTGGIGAGVGVFGNVGDSVVNSLFSAVQTAVTSLQHQQQQQQQHGQLDIDFGYFHQTRLQALYKPTQPSDISNVNAGETMGTAIATETKANALSQNGLYENYARRSLWSLLRLPLWLRQQQPPCRDAHTQARACVGPSPSALTYGPSNGTESATGTRAAATVTVSLLRVVTLCALRLVRSPVNSLLALSDTSMQHLHAHTHTGTEANADSCAWAHRLVWGQFGVGFTEPVSSMLPVPLCPRVHAQQRASKQLGQTQPRAELVFDSGQCSLLLHLLPIALADSNNISSRELSRLLHLPLAPTNSTAGAGALADPGSENTALARALLAHLTATAAHYSQSESQPQVSLSGVPITSRTPTNDTGSVVTVPVTAAGAMRVGKLTQLLCTRAANTVVLAAISTSVNIASGANASAARKDSEAGASLSQWLQLAELLTPPYGDIVAQVLGKIERGLRRRKA